MLLEQMTASELPLNGPPTRHFFPMPGLSREVLNLAESGKFEKLSEHCQAALQWECW